VNSPLEAIEFELAEAWVNKTEYFEVEVVDKPVKANTTEAQNATTDTNKASVEGESTKPTSA